ncbi:hypothetical protein PR003_g26982 [Phytophthora rubi]|uniref:Uncharacterized protein n=1 Tax=Phytophthora rubi TaxID=129364 RepID=A0A6A4C5B5_9STRA|nr:hypothetical protein PR002_g25964 [Phytophthora rubi]KAE8975366.1 hypothetical protein PR001_g25728 [Phytophthora rubi]KAE9283979.1 hypothetical protein PR003_g26982 [Phytophthora rubi]
MCGLFPYHPGWGSCPAALFTYHPVQAATIEFPCQNKSECLLSHTISRESTSM